MMTNKGQEQQIDNAVKFLKKILLPQAKDEQSVKDINRKLDYSGDITKAIYSFVNERNINKTFMYILLSNMR